MTEAQQRRFYFPSWNDAVKANGWRMAKGRLVGQRVEKFGREEVTHLYNQVWDAAEAIATAAHRAVKPDDLRHACHVVALGKDFSSRQLTTDQTNRVVRLFEVLADPDDLGAVLAWSDPSIDRRKSLVRWINSMAPEAYVCEVAQMFSAFEYPHWENLPVDNLLSLARLLKKRTARKTSALSASPRELATADSDPF